MNNQELEAEIIWLCRHVSEPADYARMAEQVVIPDEIPEGDWETISNRMDLIRNLKTRAQEFRDKARIAEAEIERICHTLALAMPRWAKVRVAEWCVYMTYNLKYEPVLVIDKWEKRNEVVGLHSDTKQIHLLHF